MIFFNAQQNKATLTVFGPIFDKGEGILSQLLQAREQGVTDLDVYINSPGGDVFDGFAIYNALLGFNTTTYVIGQAASAASFIAMAGQTAKIYQQAEFFIHDPSTLNLGSKKQLQQGADRVAKIADTIRKAYSRANVDDATLNTWMEEEKSFTADEAVQFGFFDEIVEASTLDTVGMVTNLALNYVNSKIQNLFSDKQPREVDMKLTDEQLAKLRAKFGLADDATEEQVRDAMLADDKPQGGDDAGQQPVETEPPAPEDDRSEMEQLRNDLKKANERIDALVNADAKTKAEQLVDNAIVDYKIYRADRELWVEKATTDYAGAKSQLDKRSKDAVKPGKVDADAQPAVEESTSVQNVRYLEEKIKESK